MIFEYERGYFGKLSKIMEKFQKKYVTNLHYKC